MVNFKIKALIALAALPVLTALSSEALAQSCAGKVGEEAASCQREQAAVRQEEKRGGPQSGINYRDNALARCEPLSGPARDDCVSRVQGEGSARGSVESGGIYRETRSITIGPAPQAPQETQAPQAPQAPQSSQTPQSSR